ncbi:MAG: phosphatase PAP2 family protein [Acidimicrobiia bacterium]
MTAASGEPRVTHGDQHAGPGPLARWWHSRLGARFGRELALVVGLLLVYKYGRHLVAEGHVHEALQNAREVIGFERALGVFSEARLQDLVDGNLTIIRFLNGYYLVAHAAVTAAAFLWLYLRHWPVYRRFRNVMVTMTLVGLAVHMGFPLAPPRMFPKFGFVDTAKLFGPAAYGNGSPYKGFANQFAAMPSLHFGWALVIAWAVFLATRSRWRYLALLHPFFTLAAIVLTANHYFADAFAAVVLFAISLTVDHFWERRRNRRIGRRLARMLADAQPGEPDLDLIAMELEDAGRGGSAPRPAPRR